MSEHRIKYYPVGNGDTSLITLSDATSIIIDVNITDDADDKNSDERYDVKNDLLKELNSDGDTPFTDVFILTHPDNDHCRGIGKTFYLGVPDDYSDEDAENGLIRIDELWFSPRVFNEYHKDLSDDAKVFKKEAKRRIKLHKDNEDSKDDPGNRIQIIGYSDDTDLVGLEDLIVVPGNTINEINHSAKDDFAFFVHAPFKNDTDDNDERNDTSIVLQARFGVGVNDIAGLTMFGGDAGCDIWEKILELSEDEDLEFDLFLACHHCSWKFFNNTSNEDNSDPLQSSIDILNKKREGAIVISSSRSFDTYEDKLPPHEKAKTNYERIVGSDLMVTSEYPDKEKPQPIVFRITPNGPQEIKPKKDDSSSKSGLIGGAAGYQKTYG